MSANVLDSPAVVAQALTDAVNERLQGASHAWLPGHVLAHALLTELLGMAREINRDFMQQLADLIAADLPDQNVVRIGPRYATVLIADGLAVGTALVAALRLHADSTFVVSEAHHLHGVVLLDDVEVIDRTVAMDAAQRQAIDKQLEACKALSR